MDKISDYVEIEYRVIDATDTFGDVKVSRDGSEVIIEQGGFEHRLSADQLQELRKCLAHLSKMMGFPDAS